MKKCLLLLLLICSCSAPSAKYRLAICAMFKNEASWLKEWIVYHHHVLGAEHFYLYNNDSTDGYKEVLQPFIEQGIVELMNWNSADESHKISGVSDEVWLPYQLGAYNDCLKKALGKAEWVAMIDIDEFIVPVHGAKSLHSYLQKMKTRGKGTIKLPWRIFGTSGVWDIGPGELLIEKLTLRSEENHPWHQWFKSIHQPEAIEFCQIHDAAKLAPGFRGKATKASEFRIHHYWTRTEKCAREKRKCDRQFLDETNRLEDTAILQYVPALKQAMRHAS